ncbi:MAG TPA: hypothetical protein EYQ63_05340 [Fuerstia sp.]|nr:hypothetical protein [Fuerstiella sp.]
MTSPMIRNPIQKAEAGTKRVTRLEWLLAATIGLGLALGVWHGLVTGGGLVGGDTYPYYLPQKIVLAESFARGEIPLWHHLTGLGYPLHAESQAGVFYPTNQILYRLFPVNTAYNASIIIHYWLAFVFAWRFARCQQVSTWPALLAALVYVYGWFPARISLEWGIIGGLWLPLTLWLTELLVESPSARRFACLSGCLGIHLLAGHFALAFINQLALLLYAALRIILSRRKSSCAAIPSRRFVLLPGAVVVGLLVAAIQLVPSYELKSESQRAATDGEFDPASGHMPPCYVTQLAASWWYWHSPEILTSGVMQNSPGAIGAETNKVEAHLYWGLLPLLLVLVTFNDSVRKRIPEQVFWTWLALTAGGIIYATGWLMPITNGLPGFSFFKGPGRYLIISALGGGILTGLAADALFRKPRVLAMATLLIGCLTLPDLLMSSRYVADAVVVAEPPLAKSESSWVRQLLATETPSSVRLLAPGANVGNLFGVSCIPQYLGLGPSVYFTDELNPELTIYPTDTTVQQLRRLGVTHILWDGPDTIPSERIRLRKQLPDSLLTAVWGTGTCSLFELADRPGRIVSLPQTALEGSSILDTTPNRFEFTVDLRDDAEVILRDLMYPGWSVTVDGKHAVPANNDSVMRSVAVSRGTHTIQWTFKPTSFYVGATISVVTVLCMVLVVALEIRRSVPKHSSISPVQNVTA